MQGYHGLYYLIKQFPPLSFIIDSTALANIKKLQNSELGSWIRSQMYSFTPATHIISIWIWLQQNKQ